MTSIRSGTEGHPNSGHTPTHKHTSHLLRARPGSRRLGFPRDKTQNPPRPPAPARHRSRSHPWWTSAFLPRTKVGCSTHVGLKLPASSWAFEALGQALASSLNRLHLAVRACLTALESGAFLPLQFFGNNL